MPHLFLKILIILFSLAFLVIIFLILSAWRLGAFTSVQVISAEKGPYLIVTVRQADTPVHLPAQIEQVRTYLQQRAEKPLLPLGVFYPDSLSTAHRTAEAGGGWLVNDSTTVDSPYTMIHITKQTMALAVTGINRLIAPYKIYPIMNAWIERNGYQTVPGRPILEWYRTADSLEVQIPIRKVQYDSLPAR